MNVTECGYCGMVYHPGVPCADAPQVRPIRPPLPGDLTERAAAMAQKTIDLTDWGWHGAIEDSEFEIMRAIADGRAKVVAA